MHHHHGAIIAGRHPPLHLGGIGSAAPRNIQRVDLGAKGFGDLHEPLAEHAVGGNQQPFARRQDVDQARFHHAGPGTGEEEDAIARAHHGLQQLFAAAQNGRKLGAAMAQHGARHGLPDTLGHRGGTRKAQSVFAHEITLTRDLGWVRSASPRVYNGRMRTTLTIALALGAGYLGGLASHYGLPTSVYAQAPAAPTAEIRAQKFVLVGANGVARGVFGIEANGAPVVEIVSDKGRVYTTRWYPTRFDFHEPPTTPRRVTLLP
ncbi:hypothetical protein SBA3_1480018 [Candidatus Sulfopaludibacter sp. SbA3]|nr:hypothetical protein SBA3_1480018 [Candidatus Sulfopaludibacter sp. SbA3]